jgi:hypothetical protein
VRPPAQFVPRFGAGSTDIAEEVQFIEPDAEGPHGHEVDQLKLAVQPGGGTDRLGDLTQLGRAAPFVAGGIIDAVDGGFAIDNILEAIRGDYINASVTLDLTLSAIDNSLLTGAGVSGMLRALEQAWGRDPNTKLPDVRFTPNPHDASGRPLVERGSKSPPALPVEDRQTAREQDRFARNLAIEAGVEPWLVAVHSPRMTRIRPEIASRHRSANLSIYVLSNVIKHCPASPDPTVLKSIGRGFETRPPHVRDV